MMAENKILYEDNHIIVVNKSCGILTQSDYRNEKSLQDIYKDYIKGKYNKPGNVYLGIVHRLDRPVSGTVILAKTSKAASRLSELMKSRFILKLYCAVTVNKSSAVSSSFNLRNFQLAREKDVSRVVSNSGEKASHSYLTIMQSADSLFHVLKLNTGRKHQIRAFFSSKGTPVIFDSKYGYPDKRPYILLHAVHTAFMHPVKKEVISVTAPFPSYFDDYCRTEFGSDYFLTFQKTLSEISEEFLLHTPNLSQNEKE